MKTARLVLRRFAESDVDNLVELDSDPEVMRFLTGGRPTPRDKVENEILPWFLRHDNGFWAAEDKSTGEFLGWFQLEPAKDNSAELGYRLHRSAWGKGYATEGARALVRMAFTELGFDRVYTETMAVNAKSRRVMEKAGLRYVRTFHPQWTDPLEGTEHGEVEYAITRAEWEQPILDGPDVTVTDPHELLVGYLDWYREALTRKLDGLSDTQLRTPLEPLGWCPLGMVKHLGGVERRWMRWGFAAQAAAAAEDVVPGGDDSEWVISGDETTAAVFAAYHQEVDLSRQLMTEAALADQAALGGRFQATGQVPSLGRILFHLLQEYARHLGHLDIARQLIDGRTGE